MGRWENNARLDKWFYSLPSDKKNEVLSILGDNWENASPEAKSGAVTTWDKLKDQEEEQKRDAEIIRKQMEYDAAKTKAIIQGLHNTLVEVAEILKQARQEDTQRLETLIESVQSNTRQLPVTGEGSYVPALITYANCWRKHDKSEESPEGRPGPSNCVQTTPQSDGIHYRCLIAFSSQSPQGFARLPWDWAHEELLRGGDCPKPYSRSITRRIPIISWVFTRPDVCPLADGGEYSINKGDLIRVSD